MEVHFGSNIDSIRFFFESDEPTPQPTSAGHADDILGLPRLAVYIGIGALVLLVWLIFCLCMCRRKKRGDLKGDAHNDYRTMEEHEQDEYKETEMSKTRTKTLSAFQ